jgi:hypothetical protein
MNPTQEKRKKITTAVLIGAIVAAGTLALTRNGTSGTTSAPDAPVTIGEHPTTTMPPAIAAMAGDQALPPGHPAIPEGHPPMGGVSAMGGIPMETPKPGVTWTVPPRWEQVPHASAMRIATYRIPHVAGDAEDAELSVTRAGGDTDANIDRWLGQFDEVGRKTAKRSERTVDGLHVVLFEVQGQYSGMGSPEPEPGFAMQSAIVETPGTKHFFKMTGPVKTVEAARAELQALVDSLRVAPPEGP